MEKSVYKIAIQIDNSMNVVTKYKRSYRKLFKGENGVYK